MKSKPILHPHLLFLGLVIGIFMNGIDLLAISVAIEPMRKALSIDIATLQWFLTAFSIGNATFQTISGRFADFYGRKNLFICALLIFIASSAAIATTSSPLFIIVARFIQGASGGIFVTVGLAILMSLYPPHERTRWISGMVGCGGLGMAVGPIVGGFLIHHFSWRMVFLINVPLGLIGLYLTSRYVPALPLQRKPSQRIDGLGVLLLALTLIVFTIGISQGHYWQWTSLKTLSAFGVSLLTLISFITWERKTTQPLIEFALFKVQNFMTTSFLGFILYFGLIAWMLVMGIYLQRVAGMTTEQVGYSLIPFGLVLAIVSTQMGKLSKRFGAKPIILCGYVLSTFAFFGMAFMGSSPPQLLLASLFALYGLSFIFVNSCTIPVALECIPVEKAGIASGTSTMFRWLGGAIGAAVLSAVFISHASTHMQKLAVANPTFSSHQSLLHAIITGQQSESVLTSLYHGNTLSLAHTLINQAYTHGLMVSMLVLSALSLLALLISYRLKR